jgi:hypothetical protein
MGECDERVSGKVVTVNSSEIFNPIHSYEKMVKKLQLVALDLIAKITHQVRFSDLYPRDIHLY